MTVPVPGSLTYTYVEDGVTTVFPYPVRFLEPGELTVIREDASGVQTTLIYNVDYTVSGAGNPSGGSITRMAVTSGGKITITRSTEAKQLVDLQDAQRNPAEAVELQLDRLAMVDQDQGREIGRSVKVGYGAGEQVLPFPRPDQFIGWNSAGTKLENKNMQGLGLVQVIDEDDMASDSHEKVPTQSSVRTFAINVSNARRKASWHGLHLATTDADRRAIIQAMVAQNIPLEFDTLGTITTNGTVSLSAYTGGDISFHPLATIKCSGSGVDSNVFAGNGCADLVINGGQFIPGTDGLNSFLGRAFYFSNAENVWVNEVVGKEHRGGVIMFNGALRCGWRNPKARDSIVGDGAGLMIGQTGLDFLVTGDVEDFDGIGGSSIDGAGIGFAAQSFGKIGGIMQRVRITGWSVVRAPCYGAMVYRKDNADIFEDTIMYGDLVDTVYGRAVSDVTGTRTHGAGVYIQGAENVTYGAKIIRNTNVYTDSETLAPAAIGTISCSSGVAKADLIESPNWFGIFASDGLGIGNPSSPDRSPQAQRGNKLVLDVGVIRNPKRDAIFLKNFAALEVQNASVINPRAAALRVQDISSTLGRTISRQVTLHNFNVTGGRKDDGTSTERSAVEMYNAALDWRSGYIRGYKGSYGIAHLNNGALSLGSVEIDGHILDNTPLRVTDNSLAQTLATFTAAIAGTLLTVSEATSGYLSIGDLVVGSGVAANTYVTNDLGGGSYTVSPSQTLSNRAMSAQRSNVSIVSQNTKISCGPSGVVGQIDRPLLGLESMAIVGGVQSSAQYPGAYKILNALGAGSTPSVRGGRNWITAGGATVTGFEDFLDGEEKTIRVNGSVQFVHHATNLNLGAAGANINAVIGNVLTFKKYHGMVQLVARNF